MKIDANGTVSEAGTRGDFRACHSLDEAKEEGFAVTIGERENNVENGIGFGARVRSGRERRRRWIGFEVGGFFDKFIERFAATMKIGGAIARDGGEPAGKFGGFAQRSETRKGLEENVLHEVVYVGVGNAGEKNAVDHAGIAGIQEAKGGAIALLGRADEGVVGAVVSRTSDHGRESRVRRMEFKKCRHVVSIEMKKRLLG
jgi:hypothetical protein